MEIVKETDKELHIKTKDNELHAVKREDGGFDISNGKGEKLSLSLDQAKALIKQESSNSVQYTQISLTSWTTPRATVKDAMHDSGIKDVVLKSMAQLATKCTTGKWTSKKPNAGPEVAKCMIEYPKVIVEPHYTQDIKSMIEAFKEVDDVKLPFPKMIIISGERCDGTAQLITRASDVQDGTVNFLYCYCLSQKEDGIDIDILFSKPDKSMVLIQTAKIFHNGTDLEFYIEEDPYDTIERSTALKSTIVALYMMTMGKNNFYMSVPTPEEAATNRKRISKGKKPLIEFKVATIEGKKTMVSSTPHGTHASPRLHWRRGHWRTMSKSGKKTWIAPMEVGDEDNGRVIKTYAIGKYSLLESRT
jgi:hypothetical protein